MANTKLVVYTKQCPHSFWSREYASVKLWALDHSMELDVRRTALNPKWHAEAVKLWGNDDYEVFVVIDGEVIELMDFIDNFKSKLVRAGKSKAVVSKQEPSTDDIVPKMVQSK